MKTPKGEAEQMEMDGLETYGDGLMVVSTIKYGVGEC